MSEKKILYNVTIKLAANLEQDWLQWMQSVHIPDVMKTGKFESYQINKIFQDEEDAVSFAIQYTAPSMDSFQDYQNNFAKHLQKDHTERYQNKYVAFRTLMEIIDPA